METTATPLRGFEDRPVLSGCRGQFVLSRSREHLPRGWRYTEAAGWHLATNDLPVRPLVRDSEFLGWCVGYPIGDTLDLDPNQVESFYERCGGSWALLLVGVDRLMLDPGGQMPVVYHREHDIIASTAMLILSADERDAQLERALGFPDHDGWFPFSMTSRPNIRRLLPNHFLNLDTWTVHRHWPGPETDLAVRGETRTAVGTICGLMSQMIETTAARYPLSFTLTAGYDSRMVLATAHNVAAEAKFLTYSQAEETSDTNIAHPLAVLGRLDYRLIPIVQSDEHEMQAWLDRTGHAAAGGIWKIHKTLTRLDPTRVLVTGMGGEVGRGFYYRRGDSATSSITPEVLIARFGLPTHPRVLEAAADWLTPLREFDPFTVLDLAYIEQRLGCWAAPQRFGNVTSLFEFTPFNHRRVFTTMLQLPHEYRRRDRLPIDAIRETWPELLDLPFNRYAGGWRAMQSRLTSAARSVLSLLR